MAHYPLLVRERTLQDQKVCPLGQLDYPWAIVGIARIDHGFPCTILKPIPYRRGAMGHGFSQAAPPLRFYRLTGDLLGYYAIEITNSPLAIDRHQGLIEIFEARWAKDPQVLSAQAVQ